MKVLAINFGHDASLALFSEGQLVSFLELERETRLKHTVGVKGSDIASFLVPNKMSFADIDYVALVGTQWYKAKHSDDIDIQWNNQFGMYADFHDVNVSDPVETGGTDKWYDYLHHKGRLGSCIQTAFPLDGVCQGADSLLDFGFNDGAESLEPYRIIYPYRLTVGGISAPAVFVPHQIAHAGYGAFYRTHSDSTQLIVSHDGGWPHIPFNSGGVFLFKNDQLHPLVDPGLFLGQLYQIMGERAGFKPAEAPGKLMGLSSYGVPHPAGLARIRQALDGLCNSSSFLSADEFFIKFKALCDVIEGESSNVHLRKGVGEFEFEFEDVHRSIGIAAYTQKLVEQAWSGSLSILLEYLSDHYGVTDKLAVVGGFSLNCPSNSLLQASMSSLEVAPLPGGSDMGVSIGAGALVSSFLTGDFPRDNSERDSMSPAFPPRSSELEVFSEPEALKKVKADDPLSFYAHELIEGKVFCHVEGLSEVGPRALGHRSIIAHAANSKVRDRINACKGREMWRPLAPIVREQDFSFFFDGVGSFDLSRFMLSTFRVKDKTKLPAVTHVDQTARVQSVEQGVIFDLLTRLNELHEVPVVVNTSFNLAGEPLVETFEQAISSFSELQFDYLYIDGSIYYLD